MRYDVGMLKRIDKTLGVLIVLVLLVAVAALWKGGLPLVGQGLKQTGRLIETVWLRLLLGFALAGMIQAVLPHATIARWLGPGSGLKGILIGSYTATVMTAAPFVMLPVVASLYTAGAGPGPIIALLTGTSLIGIQNLIVWQIPFLGVGVPLSKFIVGLVVTPLVGLAGLVVFKFLAKLPDLPTSNGTPVKAESPAAMEKAGPVHDKEKGA